MSKIKVCFAVTKGVWGGAQKYVYNLATSLPDRFESLVICGDGDPLPEKLSQASIPTVRLPHLKRDIGFSAEIKSAWNFLHIVRKERPDVLHLNSPKASGLGAVAGRLAGVKKIIYTVHGFPFNEERGSLSKSLIWFFSWLTIMFCHEIIVISKKEKAQAEAMPFVSSKKIVLIANGVEDVMFKEKSVARDELLKMAYQTDGEKVWIGTVAELHKNKGLEYALSAVSKITFPFIYFIMGEGEEREHLESLVAKYKLQDKVFLVGFVHKANEYWEAFDISILSSVKEGLPYTVLEAGAASVPTVATSVGGVPDIIENGVSGILVTKRRSGEITRALEYLVSNPDQMTLFGKNLQEKVDRDFSLEQMLEKTIALYN